jgi:alpha-tubulin suppressor-like RCC1 family protein
VHVICRRQRSRRGLRGRAWKSRARAAGPVLLLIAAVALCVAAPTAASAAQSPAGSVLAWGDNTSGELGDGTFTDSSTPVPVDLPAGTTVTAIAGGLYHNLAVTSNGSVLAWGDNSYGELGDGTTTDSSTPVPVDLPAGTHITAIAAGSNFSLALTSNGSVLAWGDNTNEELGDGTTTSSDTPVPAILPAGTHVTAIAANYVYSLALTSDGSVLGWGYNQDGELGDGTTAQSSTPVAVDLPAGTTVTAITAGVFHGLALTSDGSVLAWGFNPFGELGDGTTTDSSTPVAVDLPAGTTVTAIAAGWWDSLALPAQTSCRHQHPRPPHR